ncbi:MAG: putative universal stress protein [Gemmatimonadetes bacterium]|nr:putative universal stress protein [Gemmatimonadota bacterium]
MSTHTMPHRSPTLATGPVVRGGPVVVGAGGHDTASVVRAGTVVASLLGREMTLLAVIEPLPSSVWDDDGAGLGGTLFSERAIATRHELARVIDPSDDEMNWPVEVLPGQVADVLARVAREREAPILVMGIGRRRAIDRLLGAETVLRTVRLADCPVFAVAHSRASAPASAAVGVDFSRLSECAAQSAASLVAPGATLHLVHVWQPAEGSDEESTRANDNYRHHLPDRFRQFIRVLALPSTMRVKTEVREGQPAERLVDFAEAHRVDLIAIGRNGQRIVERLLVGGVAERVVRSATCSVLIAPETPSASLSLSDAPDGAGEEIIDRRDWGAHLDALARQNAGRVVSLEVNDPEHGVVSRERGFILFGLSFEPQGKLVTIALGENNGRRQHRARQVPDARRISVSRNALGELVALRIRHGAGETLLTVTPRTPVAPERSP